MSAHATSNYSTFDSKIQGWVLPDQISKSQPWLGRCLSVLTGKIKALVNCICKIAYSILYPLNLVFSSTTATSSFCEKLDQNILPLIEYLRGRPNQFAKFKTILESSMSIINTLQLADDIDHFANGKFQNCSLLDTCARVVLCAGHIMQGLALLLQNGFIALNQCLRDIRIFNLAKKIQLNPATNAVLAISSAISAADLLCRINLPENATEKQSILVEAAANLVNASLNALAISSAINPIFIGTLGIICVGLEITNLIYLKKHEN